MKFTKSVAYVALSGLSLIAIGTGCSSKSSTDDGANRNGSGGGAGKSDTGSETAGQSSAAGGPGQSTAGAYNGPTKTYDNGMETTGQIEAPSTKLPPLPGMTNVVALQGGDGTSITFDPVEGALDYRVYPLPADGDLTVAADNSFVVKNGLYRCAGNRETPPVYADNEPALGGQAIHTLVDNQAVGGYTRKLDEATLGYVSPVPGPGLVPVYALGEGDGSADSGCYFGRYNASRVKQYTTSEDVRDKLLADVARDDGIVFYVPAQADDTTTTVFTEESGDRTRYYFADGPEAAMRNGKTEAFQVLSKPAPGTQPLMRVFYQNLCGRSHDELAVGKERFNRAYRQGDTLPWWSLTWTGYTEPTTLVVEALDSGCPFQGHLSPEAMPAFTSNGVEHQEWVTIDDVHAKSTTGEVFINGQHDTKTLPKPIARAFVKVSPKQHPKMDFFEDFSAKSEGEKFVATADCGTENCYQTWRQQSPTYDQDFISVESGPTAGTGLFAYVRVLGEWWVTYADIAADTNGKYRMTAKQKASVAKDNFLHVTMEVDAYSTARRYPQILISTADAPIHYGLEKNHTLIVQPRAEINTVYDYPINYELQVCNLRTWDVNNQCPVYDLYRQKDGDKVVHLAPADEFGEHASADHRVLFDVFTSTDRTYLFMDGQPYGCAILPDNVMPAGPVTVTWGDVLYHSGVDHTYKFHTDHMLVEQRRHFDNLGFSSGVDAPKWDHERFPCAAPISL